MNAGLQNDGFLVPVLGDVGHAPVHRHGRGCDLDGLPVLIKRHTAGQRFFQTEEQPAQLVHTAVGKAAEAQYLALVQGNVNVFKIRTQRYLLCLQQHLFAAAPVKIRAVIVPLELPADHQRPHPLDGHVFPVQGINDQAVPQHRDGIAPLHQLIQIVRDEQHRLVFLVHPLDQCIDQLPALGCQCGGGLVNDQDLGLIHHGPGDLHDFPVLKIQLFNVHPALDLRNADIFQDTVRFRIDRVPVQEAALCILLQPSGKDIGGDIQSGEGGCLLNDHSDTVILGLHHALDLVFFTVKLQFTAVHLQSSRNDGAKCRFSGTVFANEAANFALPNLHIHIDQCACGAKGFTHLVCSQDQFSFHYAPPFL